MLFYASSLLRNRVMQSSLGKKSFRPRQYIIYEACEHAGVKSQEAEKGKDNIMQELPTEREKARAGTCMEASKRDACSAPVSLYLYERCARAGLA